MSNKIRIPTQVPKYNKLKIIREPKYYTFLDIKNINKQKIEIVLNVIRKNITTMAP